MTSHARRTAAAALLFLLAAPSARAQAPAPAPPQQPPDAAAVAEPVGLRAVEYGVRFGPAFTTLTSPETFDDTGVAAALEPTLNFGGFVAIDLPGPLAFQPEVLFAAKGQRIHHKDARPTISGAGTKPPQADRVILLRYLEIPLLVRASRQTGLDTSVYLIGGPAFAIRRNAVIREVANPGRLEDIAEMVSGSNLSLVYGGGVQHERWLVDARFTKGSRNVAVVPLPADVKTSAFSVLMGVRF